MKVSEPREFTKTTTHDVAEQYKAYYSAQNSVVKGHQGQVDTFLAQPQRASLQGAQVLVKNGRELFKELKNHHRNFSKQVQAHPNIETMPGEEAILYKQLASNLTNTSISLARYQRPLQNPIKNRQQLFTKAITLCSTPGFLRKEPSKDALDKFYATIKDNKLITRDSVNEAASSDPHIIATAYKRMLRNRDNPVVSSALEAKLYEAKDAKERLALLKPVYDDQSEPFHELIQLSAALERASLAQPGSGIMNAKAFANLMPALAFNMNFDNPMGALAATGKRAQLMIKILEDYNSAN